MKVVIRTFHSKCISLGACPDSLVINGAAIDRLLSFTTDLVGSTGQGMWGCLLSSDLGLGGEFRRVDEDKFQIPYPFVEPVRYTVTNSVCKHVHLCYLQSFAGN